MIYHLPYFGEINLANLSGYYHVETTLADNKLSLDLNFDNQSISREKADSIKNVLRHIEGLKVQHKDFIKKMIEQGDEEGMADELLDMIGGGKSRMHKAIQLTGKLRLARLGFYPDGKYGADYFSVFDYVIEPDDPYGQVLIINTNEQGKIAGVSWES